jgi:hypothetical protein
MSEEWSLPPAEFDGPWKDALDHGCALFLSAFAADVHAAIDWREDYEALDQELQKLAPESASGVRRVDRLFKAVKHDGDPLYLHLEAQMQQDPYFGSRTFTYRYRIRDRFSVSPVTIAILGDDDPKWKPAGHVEGQFGCEDRCRFITVKLLKWARKLRQLERSDNVFCLFVAAHLEALTTRQDAQARVRAKVRLLGNLLARGLDQAEERVWGRLIDWLLRLPPELERQVNEKLRRLRPEESMTYITSWERMGREEGRRSALRTMLEARFDAAGAAFVDSLPEDMGVDKLDALIRAGVTAATLEEVRKHLANGH